ncbi:MAG: flippase-like domain-containing protein [Cellvibrionaceae bacterium]|nr:flippase-like domain-containing protein [Cellvibrionaceae bacterium]
MNRQVLLKTLVAGSLLLGLVLWVHLEYGWSDTLAKWSAVSQPILLLGIVFTLSSHFLRALRVHFGYQQQLPIPFAPVLGVSLVHNTLSFLLPMRLGELALPILSKKQLAIDLRYSTATLLLLRLFDLHVITSLLMMFAGKLWLSPSGLLIISITLLTSLPLAVMAIQFCAKRHPKLQFIAPLVERTRVCATLYLLTALIWGIKLFSFALLASLLGGLAIDHAWLATIIADASALSPITGFANAGTFEAAFALPLIPLGYDAGQLIQVAVNLHIFIFVVNMLAGISGLLFLRKKSPTKQ